MSKRITLANLESSSAQEVFDYICDHLLTQNAQSLDVESNVCRYRTSDGLKCAAGCLLSDEEYAAEFVNHENSSWYALVERGVVPSAHSQLICTLQKIHDKCARVLGSNLEPINIESGWAADLADLANNTNLQHTELLNERLNQKEL